MDEERQFARDFKRGRYGGAGAGAGSGASRAAWTARHIASSAPVRRALSRQIRLWNVKDGDGHREDRDFCERPIRPSAATLLDPHPYVEPTSRANLFSWIVPRGDSGTDPSVQGFSAVGSISDISDSRNVYYVTSSGTWENDANRRQMLMYALSSSFISTRYGLCRIRERTSQLTAGTVDPPVDPTWQHITDIVPWGASSMYPTPFGIDSASDYPQAMSNMKATDEFPWVHPGSGCLPLFYMDQPNPYMPARASVVRDYGRFGDSVRLKYRELKMVIEEFPFTNAFTTATGLWVNSVSNPSGFGLIPMPPRPADRVRVILFSRRRRSDDEPVRQLYPPVVPPAPSAGTLGADTWQSDVTYDTPSNGEMLFTWPTDPSGDFVIHEDVVLEYPPYKSHELPHHGVFATTNTSSTSTSMMYPFTPDTVFSAHGTDGFSYNTASSTAVRPVSGAGTMSHLDADGLPHNRRKITFYRKFNDDGKTLRWVSGSGDGEHEMTPQRPVTTSAAAINSAAGATSGVPYIRSYGDGAGEPEIDICERELFVTVLTGAYLEPHLAVDSGTPSLGVFVNAVADVPVIAEGAAHKATGHLAWRLAPANVCMPSLVSVKTKMWYADEPLQGVPPTMVVRNAAGVATGRISYSGVAPTNPVAEIDQVPLGMASVQTSRLPPF